MRMTQLPKKNQARAEQAIVCERKRGDFLRKLLSLFHAFSTATIDLREGCGDQRVGGDGEKMDDGICHAIIPDGGCIEEETDPDQFALAEKFDDGRADVGTERKTENFFSGRVSAEMGVRHHPLPVCYGVEFARR
jgi:hypothetical protein